MNALEVEVIDVQRLVSLNLCMAAVQFPSGAIPASGMKLQKNEKVWKISGILTSVAGVKDENHPFLQQKDKNVWQCHITSLNHEEEITKGCYNVCE